MLCEEEDMYLRFVGGRRHPHAAAELGIFQAEESVDWQRHPVWMKREFERAFKWCKRLSVPGIYSGKRRHRHAARSLCWLKPEADWVIGEFRHAAWLLTEAGVPIREIRLRPPSMILWQDDDQIVSLPGDVRVPRASR